MLGCLGLRSCADFIQKYRPPSKRIVHHLRAPKMSSLQLRLIEDRLYCRLGTEISAYSAPVIFPILSLKYPYFGCYIQFNPTAVSRLFNIEIFFCLGHIKPGLTTAQSTSETSSSTEPLVQISEPPHRTSRTNRRGVPTSLGVPNLCGTNPNACVSSETSVKTEGDPVQPTSSRSSDPRTSSSKLVRSAGSPPAPSVSKHPQLSGSHQFQKLRPLQIVSSSGQQLQPAVSSVHTNKSVRSPILPKTHTRPLRSSARLTERPLTTEGRVLRPSFSYDRSDPAGRHVYTRQPDFGLVVRLAACVQPCPDAPDFRLGGDPWLGSPFQSRTFLLARAKGRLAARLAARDYFPNDVVAIAKELPRMNRFLPLITPNEVLKRMSDGSFTPAEAMERLILLLAPQHAWKLYHEMAPEEPWSVEMLHRLLDLLCATSSSPLYGNDLSCLPDADEVYFMDELAVFEKQLNDRHSTSKPIITFETSEVSGEADEIDTVIDSTDQQLNITETSASTFHARWSLGNHAEQLFNKKREILQTCAGYSSMIRGAAKHHNPERALQLAEEAWNIEAVGSCLDVTTYSLLLRSLHHLNKADLWPIARPIFDRMIIFNHVPDMQVFSSFLYSLAESVISWTKRADSPSVIEANLDNHIAIGLGLLDEIRLLGLEPSLGVMANLLRTIHFAHLPVQPGQTDRTLMNRPSYSASELLDSFVSELELRFKRKSPSRWDEWTSDDFSFFPIAMRIASIENNLTLAWKIDNLLVGTSDHRFFLSTSQHKRTYVFAYSLLVNSNFWINRDNPLHVIQRVERLYRTYRDVITATSKTVSRIISICEKMLTTLPDKNASADQMEAKRLAYLCLCDMFSDLTDQFRFTSNLQAQKSILLLAQMLAEHASQNPSLAVTTAMNVLTRLKLAAEKSVLDATRRASESSYLIQMNFPAAFQLLYEPEHHLEPTSSQQLVIRRMVNTLHEWFTYAVAQGAVVWSWAPPVIRFLWEHDDDLNNELVWDALLQLSTLPCTPTCQVENSRYQNLLNPVLNALDQSISASASGVHLLEKRRELLGVIRQALHEAASEIPLQSDSSSNSRVTVTG
ncbi:hypothetical protein AHF37_07757 [Paragonimus kellicotti]|nr:hypothetical protein AHF37_07757 [Paragonimus kellicotti]